MKEISPELMNQYSREITFIIIIAMIVISLIVIILKIIASNRELNWNEEEKRYKPIISKPNNFGIWGMILFLIATICLFILKI